VPFQVTSYTLPSSIENGTIAPGTSTYSNASAYGKINATSDTLNGNAKNNVLTGNEGNNTLNGGAGNDVLTGGDGQDTFRFADALANNIDTITDFNPADDSIELSHLVFSRLTTLGALNSNNFHIGVAADNNDYILYNPSTGVVSYDSDGTGRGAAVSIAILGSHPTLTNSDFIVI
jgi:Ca2+-binding RTX toxin-like protein